MQQRVPLGLHISRVRCEVKVEGLLHDAGQVGRAGPCPRPHDLRTEKAFHKQRHGLECSYCCCHPWRVAAVMHAGVLEELQRAQHHEEVSHAAFAHARIALR